MIDRWRQPRPAPPAPTFQIVPRTNWLTLPQRIAEGIFVALVVGALFALFRLVILARKQ